MVKWRQHAESGLAGLEDAPRPGGPRRVLTDEVVCQILAATVTPPESLRDSRADPLVEPAAGGLATPGQGHQRQPRLDHRLWRGFCLQPHCTEGFKFSTDPQLDAKVRDVVGLYLKPPQNAIVVRVDEKPRSRPWTGPARSCRCARASPSGTHGYIRHGTTALFAALEVATGTVTDACYPAAGTMSSCAPSRKSPPATRARNCTWSATTTPHKHADVRAWLGRPASLRITLHFVPTSCSWLNLVECFFSVITRQAIRRGSFASVSKPTSAIGAITSHWNDHPRPLTWTKDTDEILDSIQRTKTKTAGPGPCARSAARSSRCGPGAPPGPPPSHRSARSCRWCRCGCCRCPARVVLFIAQVHGHLLGQRPLQHGPGHLAQQPVRAGRSPSR